MLVGCYWCCSGGGYCFDILCKDCICKSQSIVIVKCMMCGEGGDDRGDGGGGGDGNDGGGGGGGFSRCGCCSGCGGGGKEKNHHNKYEFNYHYQLPKHHHQEYNLKKS